MPRALLRFPIKLKLEMNSVQRIFTRGCLLIFYLSHEWITFTGHAAMQVPQFVHLS